MSVTDNESSVSGVGGEAKTWVIDHDVVAAIEHERLVKKVAELQEKVDLLGGSIARRIVATSRDRKKCNDLIQCVHGYGLLALCCFLLS